MRKLKILIDFDDTMTNMLCEWIGCLNEWYGTDVKPEDVTEWCVEKFYPMLTKEQVHAPLKDPNFWDRVRPKLGAIHAIKWMMEQGHEVYIVTASGLSVLKEKMHKALFRYFPFLTWKNVIVAHNKQLIGGDILIDDAPHNLVGGSYEKILMSAPHNAWFDCDKHDVYRVNDWTAVAFEVCCLAYKDELEEFIENVNDLSPEYLELIVRTVCSEAFAKSYFCEEGCA